MKLVFTASVMDLLHQGHINLLEQMRELGDITLVVLHDGFTTFKNKRKLPIENLEKRTRNLIDTGLVDIVRYTFEEQPHQAFQKVIDDYGKKFELIFMRGDDWTEFPAKTTLSKNNVEIVYVPYTQTISSSKLRDEL
jgi:phosphoenolpyruvate phosphomutase